MRIYLAARYSRREELLGYRDDLHAAGHVVTARWVVVPTPEEADFFRELGQAWVEPRERFVERVRIERAIAFEARQS